jgi:hypothetical protein
MTSPVHEKMGVSMTRCKRALLITLCASLLTSFALPCSAAESAFRDLFENTLYGGLAGTLVGGALLAFTHKPGDHLEYLSYGAASGVIAGVAYSIVKQTSALVSLEDGSVRFAMPTIVPELRTNSTNGTSALMLKAELIRGEF